MNIEEIFTKYRGCKDKAVTDMCDADWWNNCPGCEYELPNGIRRACAAILMFRDDMNKWEEDYE